MWELTYSITHLGDPPLTVGTDWVIQAMAKIVIP